MKQSMTGLSRLAPLLLLMSATAATGCGHGETARARGQKPAAREIRTEAVRLDTVRRALDVTGTLAAQDEVSVSAQTDGVVTRILVDLGDAVAAGQPLVELDSEKLRYSLDQQRASLKRSLTRYGATEAGGLPPVEDTPDVRKAAAELAQAKQSADRSSELMNRGLIPRQTFDDAQAALHARQASYDAAVQAARNMAADVELAEATLRLAERQLRDAVIRAPSSGRVQKRLVSSGELVKNQTPVMTVVRIDTLKVKADVPERMAPWIQIGQPVSLKVDAFPDRSFSGTVARISPSVEPGTRTFAFEGVTLNADGALKPGTFVRVHLETALNEQVLTIPHAAMQYRYGVNRVFVVTGDTLAARELKLGDRRGDRTEVADGVKAGELIAVTDVDTLADGARVSLRADAAAR